MENSTTHNDESNIDIFQLKKEINNSIGKICNLFNNVQKSKEHIATCRNVLNQLHKNGVHVENAFKPLDEQYHGIEKQETEYLTRLCNINQELDNLKNEIEQAHNNTNNFGKLTLE